MDLQKSALPVSNRVEAIKSAGDCRSHRLFEDLGATHKPLKAARYPQMPHSPSESHGTAALRDESVIVELLHFPQEVHPRPQPSAAQWKGADFYGRNDGIDRTFARNQDLPTLDDVAKVQGA